MLLKDKLDQLKQDAAAKKEAEALEKGKKEIVEIDSKKETLQNKISNLRGLLTALENAYAESKKGVAEFAQSSEKINKLFEEYSAYLKESGVDQGLNSVSDILNDKEFDNYEEVKDYHGKAKNLRGVRAKKVAEGEEPEVRDPESIGKIEKLSLAKKNVKEALPNVELNFRGKKKEGTTMSPREESILKIKNYIKELEQKELSEIKTKESEAKAEYLPKIKEMISRNLDKMLPDERATVAALSSNFSFISPEIFEFCGDELWPETKKIAQELIKEKYKSKGIGYREEEASDSLEVEKLIYDARDIRDKHDELLNLDYDRQKFEHFKTEIENQIFHRGPNQELIVKDGIILPNSLLKQAEYFKEKNPAAKEVCEKSKQEILTFLQNAKKEAEPNWLTTNKTRDNMKTVQATIEGSIKRISNLEAPDNYYTTASYAFSNSLHSALPDLRSLSYKQEFNSYKWLKTIVDELETVSRSALDKINSLNQAESQPLSQLIDQLYHFNYIHSGGKTPVGGFEVPSITAGQTYPYKQMYDKKPVDEFLKKIEGHPLSKEDFEEKFQEEMAVMENRIKEYPNSEEIINRFNNLLQKYDQFVHQNKERLIDTKLKSKINPTYRSPKDLENQNSPKYQLFYQKV